MKVKKVFALLLIGLLVISCKESTSEEVLSKEKMINILVDYSLATEKVAMSYMPKDSSRMYMQQVYKPEVLSKHQVSEEGFDKSYLYYIEKPKVFSEMQGAVADTLKLMHLRGDLNF